MPSTPWQRAYLRAQSGTETRQRPSRRTTRIRVRVQANDGHQVSRARRGESLVELPVWVSPQDLVDDGP